MQKWLHFGIFIGTIATTLLNFIPPDDRVGLISAWCFTGVALGAIAYSAIIFVYRAYRLRERRAEGLFFRPDRGRAHRRNQQVQVLHDLEDAVRKLCLQRCRTV